MNSDTLYENPDALNQLRRGINITARSLPRSYRFFESEYVIKIKEFQKIDWKVTTQFIFRPYEQGRDFRGVSMCKERVYLKPILDVFRTRMSNNTTSDIVYCYEVFELMIFRCLA